MSSTRQLAAIMFTDIVGYTAMMGEDEQKAFEMLYKNRQIQQPIIKQFNGTWIKELGDGVLASFYTVTDAVLCAAKIQKACTEYPDLNLRIGIHLGEVLFEDNDVFGDGVNIASRIQALAPSGAVWISEAVNKIVSNKKEFKTRFVREEVLKNVKDAIQIYEVDTENIVLEDINILETPARLNKRIPEKSIAVLPFVNMSNDPEQEYFSDGVTEEIINSLAHLKDLKVAGRMSSFQFKGANSDLRIIGEKLGVSTVMEGSIRKQGNTLRITVQLINVQDGFHLWSEKYDRTLEDIFAIQDEIALAITEKLQVTLLQKDRDLITKSHTQNPEAYEMYLKGRFHVIRRGASILTGIKHFQKAIEIDPDFALAYAGYADANLLLATYGLVHPKQVMILARQLAEKAIQLDPSLCEPYCTLAYYYTCYEWKWPEAKKHFLKSIKLNPRYAEVLLRFGCNYLSWVEGNFDEGEKHGKKAIKVEPLHSVCYGTHSLILHTAGKFKEALEVCKMGIELDANSFLCRLNEGNIYVALQLYEDAISSYESAMKISNRHHFAVNGLIWTYCIIGKDEMARSLMNELKERSLKEYITSTFTGISAAYMGNLDEAFDYLEKAYNDREPVLLAIKYENWVPATVREDPRFRSLLERIGFP